MSMSKRQNKNGKKRSNGKSPLFGAAELAEMSDDELLDLRFCDLDLSIEGTHLEKRIAQLDRELSGKKITFRPHFWLSEEWFTPDGVPGVAIPFYLADKRLAKLERAQMFEVEGGTAESCMRILRHEVGHAIDNAYRLRRRKSYRQVFGNVSTPYPESYNPRPYSRSFVVNIDLWYAQSHPVEDFAETFAVWLKPRSCWRQVYRDWPAIKKLEFVDKQLRQIRDQKPVVKSKKREQPLNRIKTTLREHYREKRAHYGLEDTYSYDHDLRRLFTDDQQQEGLLAASTFLRRIRSRLRRQVAEWTGHFQYTIDQVLDEMIDRCRDLQLRVDRSAEEVERNALIILTIHTMNYIQDESHKIAI